MTQLKESHPFLTRIQLFWNKFAKKCTRKHLFSKLQQKQTLIYRITVLG